MPEGCFNDFQTGRKIKDYFLLDTSVENLFINEYMAAATRGLVKVYLFAQMYADLGQEITIMRRSPSICRWSMRMYCEPDLLGEDGCDPQDPS